MGLARDNPSFASEIDAVTSDHEAGSYALTKWLISQGRKRILRFWQLAVSGPSEVQPWLTQRNAGYERAMRECGVEPLPAVEIFDPGYHNFNNTEEDFKLQSRLMAGYLVEHLAWPKCHRRHHGAQRRYRRPPLRRSARAWQGAKSRRSPGGI